MEFLIGIIGAEVLGSIVLSIVVGALAIMFVPDLVANIIVVTICIAVIAVFITSLVAIVRGGSSAKTAGVMGVLLCAGIVTAVVFGDAIQVKAAKSSLAVENLCPDEEIIRVGVLYGGDEKWTTVWSRNGDTALDKVPLKKNGRPFSLRIDTENKEDGRHLPRQKHRVFFEWRFIYPKNEPSIRVTYDGARILIHGDAVTVSDESYFNGNTIILYADPVRQMRYSNAFKYQSAFIQLITPEASKSFSGHHGGGEKDGLPYYAWITSLNEGSEVKLLYSNDGHKIKKHSPQAHRIISKYETTM